MESIDVTIDLKSLRSWMIYGAVCCYMLSALLGIPGFQIFWNVEYKRYIRQDLIMGGIASGSAVETYFWIRAVLYILIPVLAAMMAYCLQKTLIEKGPKGMGLLCTASEWLVRGLNCVGILGVGLFAVRFFVYTIGCLQIDGGAYNLYAMVMMEGLMLFVAAFGFCWLRRFTDCLCDSAASIAHTLASGKLSSASVPGFTATGFLLMGLVCLALALTGLLNLIPVYRPEPHYELRLSVHPVQWASSISFLCTAVANILLSIWLKRFKRFSERTLYREKKRRMETVS